MAFGYRFSVAVFAAIGTFLFVSRGQTGTSGIGTNWERDLTLELQLQVSISYISCGQGLTCTFSNCSYELDWLYGTSLQWPHRCRKSHEIILEQYLTSSRLSQSTLRAKLLVPWHRPSSVTGLAAYGSCKWCVSLQPSEPLYKQRLLILECSLRAESWLVLLWGKLDSQWKGSD